MEWKIVTFTFACSQSELNVYMFQPVYGAINNLEQSEAAICYRELAASLSLCLQFIKLQTAYCKHTLSATVIELFMMCGSLHAG